MFLSTLNIKNIFINFFKEKDHLEIESSSLIPKNDSSILFTNSGMNQFKNIFLGIEKPIYNKIVTIQRCLRAGGKDNDLSKVGYSSRHHTFFEMLGNFSFNSYFKKSSIEYAWELLTNKNFFNISENRLIVTVYYNDIESYNIWNKNIGISKKKIFKIGDKNNRKYISDNFWSMSEFGPCGPSSEIFCNINKNNCNYNLNLNKISDEYIEIWNLVFIQFNKCKNNNLTELPYFSVDTGMGLERISSIIQEVDSNYKIDLFKDLINKLRKKLNIKYNNIISLKIIADHLRSCIFLISDGIYPSNDKHGYVLKKIIRRSIYHGKLLGVNFPFLYKIIDFIDDNIKYFYTYNINIDFNLIKNIIYLEECKFENSINKGLIILNKKIDEGNTFIDGDFIFLLYDTYGLPIEIINEVCNIKNINFDNKKFNKLLDFQKNKSNSSKK
ncbi:alanine--tRNA ligase [endosymbiont of Pachyrhynchus infernalis]|uniref:alanine--tRNA ligase n=1 Tax=endosymbiont of Pachyrhynchus infernalis TaxID=1971488 RepID=UPI000DC6E9D0|nr:alanine--tRNA ligase [endosymbiont of Pachyrhynchus infernalis]BBA84820.1 alanine--tRNA ligase [endosymbiont of Pachyrhynchus infernalis]